MKAIRVIFAGLLGCVLCCGSAWAQEREENRIAPESSSEIPTAPTPMNSTPTGLPATTSVAGTQNSLHTLSNWITYNRNSDTENLVPSLPLGTEFFVRAGPSVPLGGTTFGKVLDTGWMFDGGVRVLYFNQAKDAAWTVSASISNVNNASNAESTQVPVTLQKYLPTTSVVNGAQASKLFTVNPTIRHLNRTFVNLGLGREWYLGSFGQNGTCNWRWGVDGGIRYGTAKVDFNPFTSPAPVGGFATTSTTVNHGTDVIGGTFAALHANLEVPCGCCILQYGARGEWSYTWSDILQGKADLQELNFLLNAGVRY